LVGPVLGSVPDQSMTGLGANGSGGPAPIRAQYFATHHVQGAIRARTVWDMQDLFHTGFDECVTTINGKNLTV